MIEVKDRIDNKISKSEAKIWNESLILALNDR